MNNTYPKKERLKQETEISLLFQKGKWDRYDNITIITLGIQGLENNKVGVSVSKKFFKRAVDRNRIKRLLRESYRLHKDLFQRAYGEENIAMLFWKSNKMPEKLSEVESLFTALCEARIAKRKLA